METIVKSYIFRHKTKGGQYKIKCTALPAGSLKSLQETLVVYEDTNTGSEYVRTLTDWKESMERTQ